jgi:hypothetical protein
MRGPPNPQGRSPARAMTPSNRCYARPPGMTGRTPGSGRDRDGRGVQRRRSGEKIGWMQSSEVQRALAAAMSTATALGLAVEDAIVLHDSNKLTVRLLPCDVVARVAPAAHQVAQFEVELARRLAETDSPVAALEPRVEPRVYERDGFVVTLWTYYEPVHLGWSHLPSMRMLLSDCMPACASSMSGRRTSRIEWKRLSSL